MRTDYFLKMYIMTTYTDNKSNIFQVDIFNKEIKTTYRVKSLEMIDKIKELIK